MDELTKLEVWLKQNEITYKRHPQCHEITINEKHLFGLCSDGTILYWNGKTTRADLTARMCRYIIRKIVH